MKLWPSWQVFFRNSLISKLHPSVAFAHVQITYFEAQSYFTDQFLEILKWLFSFSSQRHYVTLRFFKISLKKEDYWWHHFLILIRSSTKRCLTSKLCTSHVSQSVTSSIIIISQLVLLVRISTAYHALLNYSLLPWSLCLHTTR